MKANIKALLLTVAVIAVLSMLMPAASAETVYIHGYVKYGNTPVNGVTVSLIGGFSGERSAVTANNGTNAGYYQFAIENGSGNGYTLKASYNGSNITSNFMVPASGSDTSISRDLTIPLPTPTPTPSATPTPTPTPRPSGEMGGPVTRNDSSSFMPVAPHNPSPTPIPKPSWTPTPAPTTAPTPTPSPPGLLSNVYLWLVIALVAILAIAAAALLYMRK